MKILITGANGFIGRNLATSLESEHEVTKLTHQMVDLADREAVNEFFKGKSFDVVLHCAMVGGRRYITDGPEVLYKNLAMFYNLLAHQDRFGKLINFGSGAELDRHNDINKDSYFKDAYPLDHYGMAKNIICRLIENEDKCFNIRLFNVFGADEESARFIRANIQRYIDREPIIIHQDKIMDFFYIDDLITLVKFYINKSHIPEEINAVYKDKYTLSGISTMINSLSNYEVDVIVEKEELSKHYVGKNTRLDLLKLPLKELAIGIKETYNKLK